MYPLARTKKNAVDPKGVNRLIKFKSFVNPRRRSLRAPGTQHFFKAERKSERSPSGKVYRAKGRIVEKKFFEAKRSARDSASGTALAKPINHFWIHIIYSPMYFIYLPFLLKSKQTRHVSTLYEYRARKSHRPEKLPRYYGRVDGALATTGFSDRTVSISFPFLIPNGDFGLFR